MERPIIFSAPMVRAILEGRKTQTRRILKPQPNRLNGNHPLYDGFGSYSVEGGWKRLPYAVGDRLWVREAWNNEPTQWHGGSHSLTFKADQDETSLEIAARHGIKWRPSIHMPRWASRITLTVTAVKVERLQEISEDDAKAEGIKSRVVRTGVCMAPATVFGLGNEHDHAATASAAFADLWNSINGPNAWAANPWVVAVSFTVEKAP